MFLRYIVSLATLLVALARVNAVNDWSKPCFDGECAYDIPDGAGVSGAIKLYGSSKAITDVTPAAGWVILDCDPNTLEQDVRLVCETEHEGSGCNHVFDHHGPSDKIVRLPEACGHGPFARLVSMIVAQDQTLPHHAQAKLRRRDGPPPVVHVMTIDTNWAAIDHAKSGDVNFGFVGVTVPGIDLNEAFAEAWYNDVGNWFKGAANTVAKGVTDAANAVAKGVTTAVNAIGKGFQDLGNLIADKTKFEITPKIESPNISLNADLRLTDGIPPPPCGPGSFHSRLDVAFHSEGSIKARAGIIVAGSILPLPKITKFAAYGGLNGGINAKLHVDLGIQGGFNIEKKLLKDVGLPGLSIPALITIGPYLAIVARAQGYIELDVTADVTLSYSFDDIEFWYPKEYANSSKRKGMKTNNSDFNLQASAHLSAKGFVQGTLAGQIHLGITAIGGAVSASLYVEASPWVRATVVAQADASVSVGKSPGRAPSRQRGGRKREELIEYSPPYSRSLQNKLEPRNSIGFSGCAWIDLGIYFKGGAEGSIFGWKAEGQMMIWESPAWQVFNRCWAVGSAKEMKGVSKPTYTIQQVDDLSKGKKDCSAAPALSDTVKDKVQGKALG